MEQNQNGGPVMLDVLDDTHYQHMRMALDVCVYSSHRGVMFARSVEVEAKAMLMVQIQLAAEYRQVLFWKSVDRLLTKAGLPKHSRCAVIKSAGG